MALRGIDHWTLALYILNRLDFFGKKLSTPGSQYLYVFSVVFSVYKEQFAGKRQTSLPESGKLDGCYPQSKFPVCYGEFLHPHTP